MIRQQAGEVLVLNEFGGRILELLDGSRSLAEVVAALGSEFDSEAQTLRADVLQFVGELEEAGLVEPAEGR
ncbi:MAG: pyrroloquinoline quinone biosynthesis peptide chaperone PqqD [Acidobacteria bacterium]|nr:pyrroloquinoline quinone biosynthesis peptide chaperone PqqD [Acidobacteriota bacterium]